MNNLINEIHESLIRLGELCNSRPMETERVIRILDGTSNMGIQVIDSFYIIVFYWQHKGKTELRVSNEKLETYRNNGLLEEMQNECKVLTDLINEYVAS